MRRPTIALLILTACPALMAGVGSVPDAQPDADWLAGVTADIRASEYHFARHDGRLQAPNRRHGLRTLVGERGFEVVSRIDGAEGFRVSLQLVSIGRGADPAEAVAGLVSTDESRVVIAREGLDEWLINEEDGLEHGFTLHAPPAGDPGRVELTLSLETSLLAYPLGDRGVMFKNHRAEPVLRYDGLVVFDARDEELTARMEIGTGELRIVFDDTEAVYPVTVDPVMASPDQSLTGPVDSQFGFSVKTAGDVNGDGYSDVIIGAPFYDGGQTNEGAAYVYLGGAGGVSGSIHWSIESNQSFALLGWSVSTAGDVNGDNYDDVIVGAKGYSNGQSGEGRAWVYHGSNTGLDTVPDWDAESDQANAEFGASVSFAGDVNNDTYHEVIVGAPLYDSAAVDTGRAFLYIGTDTGLRLSPEWEVSSTIAGVQLGASVSAAGDVNGDGYGDLIVGSPKYDPAGLVDAGRFFIYHGSSGSPVYGGGPSSEQAGSELGTSVSTAGDVNGDGYADVIVGAPLWDQSLADAGMARVYYGSSSGVSVAGAETLMGFDQGSERFGFSVSTAGDVNGDGFADLIIAALGGRRAHVYRGSENGVRDQILLVDDYWIGEGGISYGHSVATAGDVNGDGYSDVIIGEKDYDALPPIFEDNGIARIYHGGPDGLQLAVGDTRADGDSSSDYGHTVSFADVNGDGFSDVLIGDPLRDDGGVDKGTIFVYHGTRLGPNPVPSFMQSANQSGARFGSSISGAGDVNGDGFDDVIVGSESYTGGQTDEGKVYIYPGSASGLVGSPFWSFEANQANAYAGHSVSRAGDVNGDGYGDVIVGAYAYDGNHDVDQGRAWVFLGGTSTMTWDRTLEFDDDWSGTHFGWSVAGAGDVNGDGFDDVLVGAPNQNGPGAGIGGAHLYLGSPSGIPLAPVWSPESSISNAHFGWSVNTAGDVNGDGLADLVIGSPDAVDSFDPHTGEGAFTVYTGSATGIPVPLATRWGNQTGARLGSAVGTAGDVNGDGYSDVVTGAEGVGRITVWYGTASGFPNPQSWSHYSNNTNAGFAVSTAGDVNGDGFDDIIYGAPDDSVGTGFYNLHYGGDAEGMDRSPRSQQPQGSSEPRLALVGKSSGTTTVRMQTRLRTAAGRDRVQAVYEVKPFDFPFDGAPSGFSGEYLSSAPLVDGSRFNVSTQISGLSDGPHYKWRLRHRSTNPLFPRTPWFKYAAIAPSQRAFMTSCTSSTWYADADSDGYGNASVTLARCTQPAGHVGDNTDCNDGDASVNPGASEIKCDAIDNDCTPVTSDASDSDFDTYDNCDPTDPGDTDGKAKDCADGNSFINPGETEIVCNAIDENCSGMDDDAPDADSDGFDVCEPWEPGDTESDPADCNDGDASTWGLPGEVPSLTVSRSGSDAVIGWSAPAYTGSSQPLVYDTVRSGVASDFITGNATCVEEDGADQQSLDVGPLAAGEIRFFLAMAQNGCGRGPAGDGAGATPRDVQVCLP